MSVNARKANRHNSASLQSPSPDVGLETFIERLRNGGGIDRTIRELVGWSWMGGYFIQQSIISRLSRETEQDGRLFGCPEARLAIASIAIETGDRERARSEISRATDMAAGVSRDAPGLRAERSRAAAINLAARGLYMQLGDTRAATDRWMVYRYWRATNAHRSQRLALHKRDPDPGKSEFSERRAPAMLAAGGEPIPPRELRGSIGVRVPQVPPAMEVRFARALGLVELLNLGGNMIRLLREGQLYREYDAEVARYHRSRTFYEVPPAPEEVERIRERIDECLISRDPSVRATAQELMRTLDLRLLEECARAFWQT